MKQLKHYMQLLFNVSPCTCTFIYIYLLLSLQALQRELEESKDAQKATLNDVLHEQNVKQGRDKYKTLKQIRSGNTKHRVDQFEALQRKPAYIGTNLYILLTISSVCNPSFYQGWDMCTVILWSLPQSVKWVCEKDASKMD